MSGEREKTCLILSGGPLDLKFAARFLSGRIPERLLREGEETDVRAGKAGKSAGLSGERPESAAAPDARGDAERGESPAGRGVYDFVIAADAGLSVCEELGFRPDLAVGDFDTFGRGRAENFQTRYGAAFDFHRPEKDETDSELAVRDALAAGCRRAELLGGLGGRLDHELSNIQLLLQAERAGLSMSLFDGKNKIFVLDAGRTPQMRFERDRLYGTYVSFLPFTERVEKITLTGFKYPLKNCDIRLAENPGLGVSNEVLAPAAEISFEKGVLICVESRD